ncbi:MAG: HAD family hydrolase [Nostocoides sp.]
MPTTLVAWRDYAAVLFDLDGVLTPTATVHMAAWSEMFTAFFAGYHADGAHTSPYTAQDYYAFIDGKPRYDGVRDFLRSRGIALPEGTSEDPPSAVTVRGLGNRKNAAFHAALRRDGVSAYPGSVALLDTLAGMGVPMAVVSSSANAVEVLQAAGLSQRFVTVVDGPVAREHHLAGKPAPDTFRYAAERCGVPAGDAVVVEDAVSGVAAGAAGRFGLVIGVDRGAGGAALTAAGADRVVTDLGELA